MKKIMILVVLIAIVLTGCGTTYEQATGQPGHDDWGNGYFVKVYEWGGTFDDGSTYTIVYAKDTKVQYLVVRSQHGVGITPLYNADGSLQIYKGEDVK